MARLTRWGNSIGGLRLPKAIIEAAGLRVGDEIRCRLLDNGTILLMPTKVKVALVTEDIAAVSATELEAKW